MLDVRTIAIPQRPGKRRADSFRIILQNPKAGLVFLVPSKGETLGISGTARIIRDARKARDPNFRRESSLRPTSDFVDMGNGERRVSSGLVASEPLNLFMLYRHQMSQL